MPLYDQVKGKEPNSIDPEKFKTKDVLAKIFIRVEGTNKMVRELKGDFWKINRMVVSHSTSIKQWET